MNSAAGEKPYGSPELSSRYQGQIDPTESRVFEDFENQISKKVRWMKLNFKKEL